MCQVWKTKLTFTVTWCNYRFRHGFALASKLAPGCSENEGTCGSIPMKMDNLCKRDPHTLKAAGKILFTYTFLWNIFWFLWLLCLRWFWLLVSHWLHLRLDPACARPWAPKALRISTGRVNWAKRLWPCWRSESVSGQNSWLWADWVCLIPWKISCPSIFTRKVCMKRWENAVASANYGHVGMQHTSVYLVFGQTKMAIYIYNVIYIYIYI